ncbi:MAG: hypothetical protein QM706_12325 [Nitrospira sp.]
MLEYSSSAVDRYGMPSSPVQRGAGAIFKEHDMVTYLIYQNLNKPSLDNDQLTSALWSKGAQRVFRA